MHGIRAKPSWWKDYIGALLGGNELPLGRAFRPTENQKLIREMILQLKRGYLDAGYFRASLV